MNKTLMIVILVSLVVGISGCTNEKLIGGQKDEHGCLIAAGYTWCQSKQKCLRTWEEECQPEGQIIVKQSGGAGMLIIQCADKNYITNTADYIIEGIVEKVEGKCKCRENTTQILTYTDLKIEMYIKGTSFETNKLQIITPGGCCIIEEEGCYGAVGERTCASVEDQPIFHEDKRVRIYFQERDGEFSIVCAQMGVEEI